MPALGALFALGFIGPFVNVIGHIALAAIALGVVAALPVALGRRTRSAGTALVVGTAFAMLLWLAVGYGIYLARETVGTASRDWVRVVSGRMGTLG